mmetsp:Transcript_23180/g.87745  ORF Transcript_23180/g.87745 Transcript_23180/m.87745 type:complete len:392 (+) Transcript_23180:216-1391(+)
MLCGGRSKRSRSRPCRAQAQEAIVTVTGSSATTRSQTAWSSQRSDAPAKHAPLLLLAGCGTAGLRGTLGQSQGPMLTSQQRGSSLGRWWLRSQASQLRASWRTTRLLRLGASGAPGCVGCLAWTRNRAARRGAPSSRGGSQPARPTTAALWTCRTSSTALPLTFWSSLLFGPQPTRSCGPSRGTRPRAEKLPQALQARRGQARRRLVTISRPILRARPRATPSAAQAPPPAVAAAATPSDAALASAKQPPSSASSASRRPRTRAGPPPRLLALARPACPGSRARRRGYLTPRSEPGPSATPPWKPWRSASTAACPKRALRWPAPGPERLRLTTRALGCIPAEAADRPARRSQARTFAARPPSLAPTRTCNPMAASLASATACLRLRPRPAL